MLTGQDLIEAGETVGSIHLLPLGPRDERTLAYRVEFTFAAEDPALKQRFWWGASDYVVLQPESEDD